MSGVDTTGIERGVLLAALYNRAQAQGMGWLQYDATPMTPEQGAEVVKANTTEFPRGSGKHMCYFDYLKGRVMKIDVLPDVLDPGLYDRDNGQGAVAGVVAQLMKQLTAPQ